MMAKIVKNERQARNYTYASLADIAKQGFEIPKMKTGTENNKEYVFYKDGEEWIRGAEIVIPENIITRDGKKVMNAAQLYGSALTFARRYTTLLALSLTTDEDCDIETNEQKSGIFDDPIFELAKEFRAVCPLDEQARILNGLNITKAEDMSIDFLQKYVAFYKKKNGEAQANAN